MSIEEVKRDARFKVESLMGMFDFLIEKLREVRAQKQAVEAREAILVDLLCTIRNSFRAKGDFANADKIRDQLQWIGVKIKDQKTQSSALGQAK